MLPKYYFTKKVTVMEKTLLDKKAPKMLNITAFTTALILIDNECKVQMISQCMRREKELYSVTKWMAKYLLRQTFVIFRYKVRNL